MNTCYLRNLICSHNIGERTSLDGNQENMQAVIDKMTNEVVLKLFLLNMCSRNVCSMCTVIHFLIGAVTSERPPIPGQKHDNSQRVLSLNNKVDVVAQEAELCWRIYMSRPKPCELFSWYQTHLN